MFFAAFAPAVTFGGLLGDYTSGIVETLMAQCLCGLIWAVVGGQPMILMLMTGWYYFSLGRSA